MKSWKLVLGAAAACAACCSAPLIGGMAALFAGGLGAVGAYGQSWLPLAAGAVGLAAIAGVVAWRRHRRPAAQAGCGCASSQCG